MGDIALRVTDLSKQYRLGSNREAYKTLRDTLTDTVASALRRAGKLVGGKGRGAGERGEMLWALKDVSFEIKRGEVVGIIGSNGAGKSTLLKILSRITEPTGGYADIYGRVGSLLEVGTGFHPELTGRENIYLNGAILGMKRVEIDQKFDEIVAFAEIERFIDTPAKRYSSGMYMRLAFAVAAHLEPEILLVDEVLAVGDARFQKKCLNKMHDVGQQGRTVLFVSHNMQAITRLCKRAILLEEGTTVHDGPAHKVVSAYLNSDIRTSGYHEWPDPTKAPGGEVARLRAVRACMENGNATDVVDIRRPLFIEMEYDVLRSGYILLPYYDIYNEEGLIIFSTIDVDPEWRQRPRPQGRWKSIVEIPGNLLAEGTHMLSPGLSTLNPPVCQFEEREALAFHVVDSLEGNSARGDWAGRVGGVIRPLLKWRTEFSPDLHGSAARVRETTSYRG